MTLSEDWETVVTSFMPTGGTTGGTGAVIAFGDLGAIADAGTLDGGVVVEFSIVPDGGVPVTPTVFTLHPADVASAASASRTFRFIVNTGETSAFHLQARLAAAQPGDVDDVRVSLGLLTLLYVPFTG